MPKKSPKGKVEKVTKKGLNAKKAKQAARVKQLATETTPTPGQELPGTFDTAPPDPNAPNIPPPGGPNPDNPPGIVDAPQFGA